MPRYIISFWFNARERKRKEKRITKHILTIAFNVFVWEKGKKPH